MKWRVKRYSFRAGVIAMVLFVLIVFILIPFLCWTADSWLKISHLLEGGELLGGVFLLAGLVLASWCAILFLTVGRGTPAIIHPPEKLVVSGPYRFVRNPMMTGAFLLLLGEALLFSSLLLLLFLFFIALPAGYLLIRYEEEDLEERFGNSYREYKKRVPRLLPRFRRQDEKQER